MQIVVDLLKQSLHPVSSLAIVLMIAVGAVLLNAGKGRWGRWWLTTVAIAYWVLATPVVATWLAWPLTRLYSPITSLEQTRGARTIVVLSGGTFTFTNAAASVTTLTEDSAIRVLEAARLYTLIGRATIVSSGGTAMADERESEGEAMADALVNLGVRRNDILVEDRSRTTYDEAVEVRRILEPKRVDRFLLVTSTTHMRRSVAVFEAQGLHPIPAAAALERRFDPRWPYRLSEWWPARRGLVQSDATLYEYAGLLFYWSKGRLG